MSKIYVVVAVITAASAVVAFEANWIRQRTSFPAMKLASEPEQRPAPQLNGSPLPPPPDASIPELAAWVRPHPGEEPWAELNWSTNLKDAQKAASRTNRLLLIWATNQPFDRC